MEKRDIWMGSRNVYKNLAEHLLFSRRPLSLINIPILWYACGILAPTSISIASLRDVLDGRYPSNSCHTSGRATAGTPFQDKARSLFINIRTGQNLFIFSQDTTSSATSTSDTQRHQHTTQRCSSAQQGTPFAPLLKHAVRVVNPSSWISASIDPIAFLPCCLFVPNSQKKKLQQKKRM